MSFSKQVKASAAVLTGLSSGMAITTINMASAHAETQSAKSTDEASQGITSLTKTVQCIKYVNVKGKIVGTGEITAEDKVVDGKKVTNYSLDNSIPAGYKLKDGQDLKQLPNKLVVDSMAGNDSEDDGTVAESKTVTYVDKSGKVVGTGKITKSSRGDADGGSTTSYSVDKTIPVGYKLDNSNILKSYPDQLTVVADPNSKEPSSASVASILSDAPSQGPRTDKEEISGISLVDENGKIVGTAKISSVKVTSYHSTSVSRTTTKYSIESALPAGYKLKNPEDLYQLPKQLVVVPISADSSTDNQSGNNNNAGSNAGNSTSGTNSDKNSTESKDNGTKNSGSSSTGANASAESGTNGTNNASNSVARSTSKDVTNVAKKVKEKTVAYVNESGKVLGTGKITVSVDGNKTIYSVDKTIPAGYSLKSAASLQDYPDKLVIVPNTASKDTASASVASLGQNNANSEKSKSTSENSDEQSSSEKDSESNEKSSVDDEDANVDPNEEENKDKDDSTGQDEGQKAVTTTTTTTTTAAPDSSEAVSSNNDSSASNTLPQTGNAHEESSLAVGAGLLTASMTAAGIAKKKLS